MVFSVALVFFLFLIVCFFNGYKKKLVKLLSGSLGLLVIFLTILFNINKSDNEKLLKTYVFNANIVIEAIDVFNNDELEILLSKISDSASIKKFSFLLIESVPIIPNHPNVIDSKTCIVSFKDGFDLKFSVFFAKMNDEELFLIYVYKRKKSGNYSYVDCLTSNRLGEYIFSYPN